MGISIDEYASKEGEDRAFPPGLLDRHKRIVCVWAGDAGVQPPSPKFENDTPTRRHLFLFEVDAMDGSRPYLVAANLPVRHGITTKYGTLLDAMQLYPQQANYRKGAILPDCVVGLSCLGRLSSRDGKHLSLDANEGKELDVIPLMEGMPPLPPKGVYAPSPPPAYVRGWFEKLLAKRLDLTDKDAELHAKTFAAPIPGADDIAPEGDVPF